MKYGLSEKQLAEIIAILRTYPDIEEAILFGSRAIDTFKEASDVDIALKGKGVTAALAAKLKFHLEEETYQPFFFDFIAYPTITNEALREHINTKGVVIFRRGWVECKLGQLIEKKRAGLQTGPFGTMLNAREYTQEGTPVIAVQDIGANKLEYHKFVYVNETTADRLLRYRVMPGDIIFGRKGAVDRRALIKPSEAGWIQGSDCIRVRFDDSIDSTFISFQFGSNSYKEWMHQNSSGATMPSLNQQILKLLPITLPPLAEQKAIASVLSSLDNKIDLLHRQNKTLEAMAETLFRQWFVEEAQEDWEDGKLGDLVTITRGASPRPIVQYVKNGTVPWIKIADATGSNSFYINSTKEFIIEDGVSKSVQVFPGDLILSNSATCGLPFFVELEGCIHDGWLLFRYFDRLSKFYIFFFLKQINRELNNVADGSVQNNLNTGILKEYELKIPDDGTLKKFDEAVLPIINKMKFNNNQIRTLEKLRDTLLPKLMSGEVRVTV